MSKVTDEYPTLTVEAARSGWIVKQDGKPAEIFVRWEALIAYLKAQLTSAP